MNDNRSHNTNSRDYALAVLRGIFCYAVFISVYKLTSLSVKIMTSVGGERGLFHGLPSWSIYLTISVAAILIFNSAATAIAAYNKGERAKFIHGTCENGIHEIFFTEQMKSILSSKLIHAEALGTILPVLLTAILGGFYEIPRIFFEAGVRDGGLSPALAIIPICILQFYLAKYEARRYWLKLWREKKQKKLDTPWRFPVRIALFYLLYPAVYPYAPLVAFFAISLGAAVAELTEILSIVGIIAATALVIATVLGIRLLRAMLKRKKFLGQLRALCAERGVELSEIKNPYKSFLADEFDCSFTLKYGTEKFDCIVLATMNRGVPFVFTSETGGYFRHRIGTNNHHIGLSHNVSFFHSGGGKKIIIVNPDVKTMLIEDLGTVKAIIPWDNIFGYTVHDTKSFLGGVDRQCLGKHEPKYH